jgi:hypothetical protein
MPKPNTSVTPEDRLVRWKKIWGTPKLLDEAATETAFEEFQEALVPRRMHKLFLKSFGIPKAQFGNRFFMDDSVFRNWDTKVLGLISDVGEHIEVTVIYGSPDHLEGHWLRGQSRRTLRDIVIDDNHAACAIVHGGTSTLYVFIEPKMKGCIVRTVQSEPGEI